MQGADTPKQHLLEIENDLIAGHYQLDGSPPAMQFRNAKVTGGLLEG
jgi:hypothetical protein